MTRSKIDFDAIAQEYDFWMNTVNGPTQYLGLLKLLPTQTEFVLDAGCGAGQLALFLADFAGHVTGVDISTAMIGRAKRYQAEQHKSNVDFIVADIETFIFEQQAYDFVVSDYTLHNTCLELALPALRRLLRPGGRLLVRDLVNDQPQRWRSTAWQRWRALKDAPILFQRHGWRAAQRIVRFRMSFAWIEHVRQDEILTTAEARAVYQRIFPGCSMVVNGQEMTVLWDAPGSQPVQAGPAALDALPQSAISGDSHLKAQPPWTEERFSKKDVETSLVQVFERQVAEHGPRLALCTQPITLTYTELNAAANRLARAILQQGGAVQEPAAILLRQEAATLVALLAVLKAGRAYVVLNPDHPPARLGEILVDAQAGLLLTDTDHIESAYGIAGQAIPPDKKFSIIPGDCQVVNVDQLDPGLSADNLNLRITPDQLAGIFYTSGSTGEPKGIARQHRQLLHSTWHNTNAYQISANDRHSLLFFCGHTASVPDIFDTLLNGATLYPFDPHIHNLSELADWLGREQISMFHPPVELFRRFVSTLPGADHFLHLRLVILGGQTVYPLDVEQFRRHFGPDCLLLHRLASTETGSTAHLLIDRQTPIGEVVPVGFATADKEILLLDETGQPVEAGKVGEIAVRSRYLAAGYWRKPELTQAKFTPDPEGGDRRIYLTGDLGRRLPDGALEHLGRKDLLVKIRGYRVQLEAVEAALTTLPYVCQGAVSVYPLPSGENRLVGYVVPQPGLTAAASELRRDLGRLVPDYMIPTAWVWLPELPMTANSKVDRRLLPPPAFTRPGLDTPFVAPRTGLEAQMAGIWAELLDLDEVGIDDNFFELGGDSLLTLRLVMLVEQRWGRTVPPDYFNQPTVASLVKILQDESPPIPASFPPVSALAASRYSEPWRRRALRLLTGQVISKAVFQGAVRRVAKQAVIYGVRGAYRLLTAVGLGVFFYSTCVRLLYWLGGRAWFTRRWQSAMKPLRQFLAETTLEETPADAAAAAQHARMLQLWRGIWGGKLDTLSRRDFASLCRVRGAEQLRSAQAAGRGVICVYSGTPFTGAFWTWLTYQGLPVGVIILPQSWDAPGQPGPAVVNVQLLTAAEQTLRQGGLAHILPDGTRGQRPILMPFFNKQYEFQSGFAELALLTGAAVLPVAVAMDLRGCLDITIGPPFARNAASGREAQVRDLVEQYAAFLMQQWQTRPANIGGPQLHRYLNLPEIALGEG